MSRWRASLTKLQGLKPMFIGTLNVAAEAATHKYHSGVQASHRAPEMRRDFGSVSQSFVGQGFSPDMSC
jgi:hypothetical protein